MLKCDNLAWRPRAYLINERDLAQEKYSDLKRLLVPWRSFQGVSDGESADFLFNDAHHHHQPPANWSSEALLHQWSHLHLTLQSPPLRVSDGRRVNSAGIWKCEDQHQSHWQERLKASLLFLLTRRPRGGSHLRVGSQWDEASRNRFRYRFIPQSCRPLFYFSFLFFCTFNLFKVKNTWSFFFFFFCSIYWYQKLCFVSSGTCYYKSMIFQFPSHLGEELFRSSLYPPPVVLMFEGLFMKFWRHFVVL